MLRFDNNKKIETVTLSDIAERITRKNKGNETDLPLTISSIDGLVDQRDYFNKKVASRNMSNYFLLKKGEFAYNKSYSKGFDYGSIKMLEKYDQGALSPLYICFALRDGINKDYMCHYFDSQKWYEEVAMICTEGARNHGILNVSPADFMNMSLTLHTDAEEQQKIADCLSSVDAVIADYEAQVENMQNQKKGVMQKLFSQEVRFKADDGSEYPEWQKTQLGIVARLYQPATISKSQCKSEGKYPVFGANGFIGCYDIFNHEKDQICISCRGANCGVVNYVNAPAWITGNSMVCNIDDNDDINKVFWFYALSFINYRPIITGGAQPQLTRDKLNTVAVQIPCFKEQQKIANCLSAFDTAIEDLQKTVERWKNIKKGLLQQLFA